MPRRLMAQLMFVLFEMSVTVAMHRNAQRHFATFALLQA
jgi:hypothetical protein